MRFDVVTVMPDMLAAVTQYGVTGRAVERGVIQVHHWDPRDYAAGRYRKIDDRAYGGGPGMVMKPEPLSAAVNAAKAAAGVKTRVLYLSPQGRMLTQSAVCQLAESPGLILLAGRYEGIDERLIDSVVDEEWSIGDYVISGGELAAMVMIDAVARLLPEVLGHEESAQQDSFMNGLLDCPHYTRPEVFAGRAVPSVLLNGNHADIARWRRMQSLGRTESRRPELLAAYRQSEDCQNWQKKAQLCDQDHLLLAEYKRQKREQTD